MFISTLQDIMPEKATHIFDIFLLQGEYVIIKLILKFIKEKQDKILSLYENDLKQYMTKGMYIDCLEQKSIFSLFDFKKDKNLYLISI